MQRRTHESAGILRRTLAAVVILAASLASTAARAQDNAAPLWRAAFKAAGYGTEAPLLAAEDQAFIADLNPPLGEEQRARLDGILQRTAEVRQQFEAAARVKRCDWELDTSKGFELLLPHLSQVREAARLLRAQAMVEIEDGNSADAIATILLLGNVGAQAGQDSILISSLVGNAVGAMQMTELAQSAIDWGAIDEKSAQGMLDAMGPLKGDDPFRFADAIQGEGKILVSSINGCTSDAELQRLISTAGETAGSITLDQAKAELGSMRQVYDRAARAFANPDPNAAIAELQRLEQQAGSGRTGALAKIFMPSLLSAYKSKLKGAQELALLVAKLQKIAEGKEKPAELRNAALLLARASAGARSVPDDAQDSIELMRVAHTALQDADAARAAEILLRSDRSVMQPLAQAIVCKRCDFAVLRHPIPTFDVRLLGGLRGATRMALADGLRHVRERTDAAAIVPAAVTAYRVAALLAMDPSLPRAAVSHSIWREATAAVQEAAKFGPIGKEGADELERALATMGSADPFGFRKGAEEDAKRLVSNATARRDATAKEAIAERAKVLKQRGPGAVWAYMAFVAIGRNKDPMPSAKDAGLVRLTDIYPQVSLDAITAAVAQAAGTERADDVPFDLPVDEQKARLRRLDPVRGVKFIDASTLMANAGADYMAAFDAVKAAASAAAPAAARPVTK